MDFRVIPPKKRPQNKYDDETYVIPVKLIKLGDQNFHPKVVPILFERIDFKSGKAKLTKGITFKKSLEIFGDREFPIQTECIVYKEDNRINFKIIGAYNPGLVEELFLVKDYILDNDENQILDVFKSNYRELNEWVGELDTNFFDAT